MESKNNPWNASKNIAPPTAIMPSGKNQSTKTLSFARRMPTTNTTPPHEKQLFGGGPC